MRKLEKWSERATRRVAQRSSRRGFLGRLGTMMVGAGAIPLLPMDRTSAGELKPEDEKSGVGTYPGVAPQPPISPAESGDPASCDYWRYCGIGGPLCACCGGSANACPPGAEMSPLSWIGTCRNPVDGKLYIISYNDCCGKPTCKRCLCAPHNPDDRPIIRPQSSSNYLWCLGTTETTFTCSTANVVGLALNQD